MGNTRHKFIWEEDVYPQDINIDFLEGKNGVFVMRDGFSNAIFVPRWVADLIMSDKRYL